ncbi:MAG: hypothetical protein PHE86_05275 [Candidatus Marinimicrobia bacterium]|nr:hypothetical protein [Candidatus Neomarinimicrobiota bacterium]
MKGAKIPFPYEPRQPAITVEATDREGWFYTKDLEVLDDDNFLYITGRLKNLMATSGGKTYSHNPLKISF